jgi:hypothetical protein
VTPPRHVMRWADLASSSALLSDPTARARALVHRHGGVARALWSPYGGEHLGAYGVTAMATKEEPALDAALLALWKAAECFAQEWPYEGWDSQTAISVHQHFFEDERTRWQGTSAADGAGFVQHLRSMAWGVVGAYAGSERVSNSPQHYPDRAATDALGLDALDYIEEPCLVVLLRNEWNDLTGLFQHRDLWLLTEWWTNA